MSVVFGSRAQVRCYRNLNLLAHAQMEELDIGSQCGGFGHCGKDRLRVLQGMKFLTPVTDAEREHLSADELAQGYRLGCQSFPQKDDAEIICSFSE